MLLEIKRGYIVIGEVSRGADAQTIKSTIKVPGRFRVFLFFENVTNS